MVIKLKDIKFHRNTIIFNISVKVKLPTTQANILTISIFQHSDSHYRNFKKAILAIEIHYHSVTIYVLSPFLSLNYTQIGLLPSKPLE